MTILLKESFRFPLDHTVQQVRFGILSLTLLEKTKGHLSRWVGKGVTTLGLNHAKFITCSVSWPISAPELCCMIIATTAQETTQIDKQLQLDICTNITQKHNRKQPTELKLIQKQHEASNRAPLNLYSTKVNQIYFSQYLWDLFLSPS